MATYFLSGTAGWEATFKWSFKSGLIFAPVTDAKTIAIAEATTFGAGADKANLIYASRQIIAASATLTLDLAGSLTRGGNTLTFAKVHGIYIHNQSDRTLVAAADEVDHSITVAVLDVQRPAANGFVVFKAASDAITLNAGDWWTMWSKAGIAVTADTGDLLSIIETAAAEAVADIIVIGESA